MKRYYSKSLITKKNKERSTRRWKKVIEYPERLWNLNVLDGGLVGRIGRVPGAGKEFYNRAKIKSVDNYRLYLDWTHIPEYYNGPVDRSYYDANDNNYPIPFCNKFWTKLPKYSLEVDNLLPNDLYNNIKSKIEYALYNSFNPFDDSLYLLSEVKKKFYSLCNELDIPYSKIEYDILDNKLVCFIETEFYLLSIKFDDEIPSDESYQVLNYLRE